MTSSGEDTPRVSELQDSCNLSLAEAWTKARASSGGHRESEATCPSSITPAAHAEQQEEQIIVNVDGHLPSHPGTSTADPRGGPDQAARFCGRRRCCWTATIVVVVLIAIAYPLALVAESRSRNGSGEGWWACGSENAYDDGNPPLCADDLTELSSEWSCYRLTPEGSRISKSREYQWTTPPSLYYSCALAPRTSTQKTAQAAVPTLSWEMQCKVDCLVVDLSVQAQAQAPMAQAPMAGNAVSMMDVNSKMVDDLWTAPERLRKACAARYSTWERGSVMDYVSFDLSAAASGSDASAAGARTLTTNVTFTFETGLTAQNAETLGLFDFPIDKIVSCEIRTGWDTCYSSDYHETYYYS